MDAASLAVRAATPLSGCNRPLPLNYTADRFPACECSFPSVVRYVFDRQRIGHFSYYPSINTATWSYMSSHGILQSGILSVEYHDRFVCREVSKSFFLLLLCSLFVLFIIMSLGYFFMESLCVHLTINAMQLTLHCVSGTVFSLRLNWKIHDRKRIEYRC